MARLFNDAIPEYLYGTAPVITYPFVMSVWANKDADVLTYLVTIQDADTANRYFALGFHNSGSSGVATFVAREDAAIGVANSSSGGSTGTYYNFCAIAVSATDRRVFFNGGNKGTNATSVTPTGIDQVSIGTRLQAGSPEYSMSGYIAEVAIWNLTNWPGATASDKADLFETIVPSLAKRYVPEFFPLGRVAYWDLRSGIKDRQGTYDLTASGSTLSAHPRIIKPSSVLYGMAEAYVPPVSGGIMTCNTGYWGAI